MLLHICRHGQTDHNLQGIIQGHLDTPLNDHGRFEAERLGEALKDIKFGEAYASPLSRAFETAQIVMRHHPDLELVPVEALKERGLGSMEGRRWARGESAPEDAESHKEYFKTNDSLQLRIYDWFTTFLQSHTPPLTPNHPNSNPETEPQILLISHGAWIGSLLTVLLSSAIRAKVAKGVNLRAHLLNTSRMVVRCTYAPARSSREDGVERAWRIEILVFGDMGHLEGVQEPDLEVVDAC